jgi:hypothetical protein
MKFIRALTILMSRSLELCYVHHSNAKGEEIKYLKAEPLGLGERWAQ